MQLAMPCYIIVAVNVCTVDQDADLFQLKKRLQELWVDLLTSTVLICRAVGSWCIPYMSILTHQCCSGRTFHHGDSAMTTIVPLHEIIGGVYSMCTTSYV